MGLFKKPKPQESESGNHAWNEIETYFQPGLGYFTSGGNAIGSLLGVGPPTLGDKVGEYTPDNNAPYATGGSGGGGGGSAQQSALSNWANSGGMKFLMDTMQKGVTSSKAAQGLLGSGSFGTALQDRAFGLGSTYLNQYMDNLFKFSNLGLGAGSLMANAGQWSKGQGPTQGGMGKQLIPMLASAGLTAAASDPALKENVELVGHDNDNIPVYEFNYRQDTPLDLPQGRFRGYMADTLLVSRPEVVTKKDGFLMVTDKKYFPQKIDEGNRD